MQFFHTRTDKIVNKNKCPVTRGSVEGSPTILFSLYKLIEIENDGRTLEHLVQICRIYMACSLLLQHIENKLLNFYLCMTCRPFVPRLLATV